MTKEKLVKLLYYLPDGYRILFRVDGIIREYEIEGVNSSENYQEIVIDLSALID